MHVLDISAMMALQCLSELFYLTLFYQLTLVLSNQGFYLPTHCNLNSIQNRIHRYAIWLVIISFFTYISFDQNLIYNRL